MSEHEHDCGCGCEGQGHEEERIITLSLDDGSEIDCAIVAIFPAGDFRYIALLPLEQTEEEEGEVFLYRFTELEDGGIELLNIESDEEYEVVADAFDALLEEDEFSEVE